MKLSDFRSAEKYTKSAIRLIENNADKRSINKSHLVRYYYFLSTTYSALNEQGKKAAAEDSCISISIRTNTLDHYLLTALNQRTRSLCEVGDFNRCIQYSTEGEFITAKILHGRDSLAYAFNFLIWKVNALNFLDEFDEIDRLLENRIIEYSKAGIVNYNSSLYERMASVKTQKKEFKAAAYFFNKSLDIDKRNKSYSNCYQTLVNMGYYLYNDQLHDYDSALYCYKKSLEFTSVCLKSASTSDSLELYMQRLNIFDNIANAYIGKGKFDSAEYFFNMAYTQVIPGLKKKVLLTNSQINLVSDKDAVYVLFTLLDEADGYLKKYFSLKNTESLIEASKIYSVADKLQNRVNSQQIEFRSRLFWRSTVRRLYEHAIETYYLLGLPDQAFFYFEKSRAVLLQDEINRQNSIGNDDIHKLSMVKQKILQLDKEINYVMPSSAQFFEVQNKIFNARQELNELEQSIKIRNPLYYQNIIDTNAISISDVRYKILKDHEALTEILEGDSNIYTLVITKKKVSFNKIDKSDYGNSADLYNSYNSNPALINQKFSNYVHLSNHLHHLIFGNTDIQSGRIIVSPDGKYFPFESLCTNNNEIAPEYFINEHAVSYTYSARYLLNNPKSDKINSSFNFLGLAPLQYPQVFNLPTLSQSDASLKRISHYFSGRKLLIASEASRNNFMQLFQSYKIIQLYTHASDNSSSAEPVIYFSDSALYLSELISENKSSAQLIVLSACETGNGKLYKGEGIFSFNRGFAALGIPSSVINLWSVENESTYKITELFYKYTAKGLPLDVALQKAKLEFISSSPKGKKLPYYWAAAILAGKTDAIETSSSFSWYWVASVVAMILIGFAIFRIKTKSSHSYSHDSPAK